MTEMCYVAKLMGWLWAQTEHHTKNLFITRNVFSKSLQ